MKELFLIKTQPAGESVISHVWTACGFHLKAALVAVRQEARRAIVTVPITGVVCHEGTLRKCKTGIKMHNNSTATNN